MSGNVTERPYMSIGEVLGLLLEEFPDVTISKIRFLESQGLIEPERTSSGYRKFYDADIERLRVILREQRENFLPLRVIRDRLETGEIDDSGGIPSPVAPANGHPRGIRNVVVADDELDDDDSTGATPRRSAATVVSARHPAAQGRPLVAVQAPAHPIPRSAGLTTAPRTEPPHEPLRDASQEAPHEPRVYVRAELCSLVGVTAGQLTEIESYGLVAGRGSGSGATYSDADLAVVRVAAAFLERGIDARHLRGWRQAAEREVALFEQRITPLLRQRNPKSRAEARQNLGELADLGGELRQALMTSLLRQYTDD
jgi:DNA-binding transcriptional MerR regulator